MAVLSREALAGELVARISARDSFADFALYSEIVPGLAAHHRLLADALTAVERGEIKRLMINLPPGSAKSTYASVLFPAWWLGRNPSGSIVAVSNTTSLAESFGRRVRNLFGSAAVRNVFGVGVSSDNAAAGQWTTTQGGGYFAMGVGGAITGRRANLGVIDDPVQSAEDAASELRRERIWDWYSNDFVTRLTPEAPRILVMTRWHEDDLAGRLLAREADQWNVLSVPMIAEAGDLLGRAAGERLWPEYFTEAQVAEARLDSRKWSALYQQRPVPEEGDYFKAEWLKPVDRLPPLNLLRVYGGSDFAVTSGGGDWTVHAVIGIDHEDNPWLLDIWRGQEAADVWIETFCDRVLKYRPIGWAGETGQINSSVGPFLRKRMRERRAFVHLETFPTRGDKAVRAQSIRGRMALCGLRYWAFAPWRGDFEAELLSFPAGKHDDQVDALGLVGQLLGRMARGHEPDPPDEPIRGIESMTMADTWKLARPRAREMRI